jgi:hypothetical protein
MRRASRRLVAGSSLSAVVVLLFAMWLFIAQPWAGDPRGPFGLDSLDETSMSRFKGGATSGMPMTRAELDSLYPFTIEFPNVMPDDYVLGGVSIFTAPNPQLPAGVPVRLLLMFGSEARSAQLQLFQSPGGRLGPAEAGEQLVVQHQVLPHDASGRPSLERAWVTWERCGRQFGLSSLPSDALTEAELVRIAESVGPEECD